MSVIAATLAATLILASAAPTGGAVTAVGAFVNVRTQGDHPYGYSVQRWSVGGTLIGLVNYHHGLEGDPPAGVLTDVRYDPVTGALSFQAKLTTAVHFSRTHQGVPSRDLLSFRGHLGRDRLEGAIVLENLLHSSPIVVDRRERFAMPRDADASSDMSDYPDTQTWWRYREPIVKLRGPKW